MASSLPGNPSREELLAEARALPGTSEADRQLTVARRYGFTGWPALEQYLEVAAPLTVDPGRVDVSSLSSADRFCALAVLHYDDSDAPPRWQTATDLLRAQPDLVDEHVWAAAAAADAPTLQRLLADDPGAARMRGGPYGWEPLLYLCYSRVARSEAETLTAARLLLDAGADPNAGYLWCGLATPFTALTGVFGEGEQGPRRQPRHPHAAALAELLLDRGAHPVDQQTLYNRMFRADDSHLELLFAYGLADAEPSPWERTLGEAVETRAQMWRRQVEWAAEHGFAARLELLARNEIDLGGARVVERPFDVDPHARDEHGATPLHHAAWDGDVELIGRLLGSGADPTVIDGRFGATPLGWAEHAYQSEAADLLRSRSGG